MTEGIVLVIKGNKMASVYCHGGIDDELVAVLETNKPQYMTAMEILEEALELAWPDWFKEPFEDTSRKPVEIEPINIPRGFLIVADCNTKTMIDEYGGMKPKGWSTGRLVMVK